MVILIAYHPIIVAAELKISLPKTVVVFPLEALGSPGLSRLSYGTVQASFTDDFVDLVMVYCVAFAVEVTRNLAGTPLVPFADLDDFCFEKTVWSRAVGATSGSFF